MANTARSKSATAASALYKSSRRWESNRKRKLERTLKAQPNNEQVKAALKSMVYRRKTPKTQEWSASWIRTAQLIKQFTGKFDRNIMSSNPKVAGEALQLSRKQRDYTPAALNSKSMFSILARVTGQ